MILLALKCESHVGCSLRMGIFAVSDETADAEVLTSRCEATLGAFCRELCRHAEAMRSHSISELTFLLFVTAEASDTSLLDVQARLLALLRNIPAFFLIVIFV